jgi:trans-2,3-dihydro-3-hydroxyanthranilate isomerase
VPVRDVETLRRAARNDHAIGRAIRASGGAELYLFAIDEGGGVVARMFEEGFDIGEDPATGSAAGPLGAYLSEHGLAGMPGSLLIRQGEQVGRPSELHVEARRQDDAWRVRVGGGVHVVGRGEFDL